MRTIKISFIVFTALMAGLLMVSYILLPFAVNTTWFLDLLAVFAWSSVLTIINVMVAFTYWVLQTTK